MAKILDNLIYEGAPNYITRINNEGIVIKIGDGIANVYGL